MAIFFRIYIKTISILLSIITVFLVIAFGISFLENFSKNQFKYIAGNQNSSNLIAVIELNGLIIDGNLQLSEITNPFIISPSSIKNDLLDLKKLSPKVLIFSINSPGGTVSASKNLYDIIKNFKKNNNVEILFHTNELLASGGYWASISADKIYASYGSIVGSIGVKGPDWFFYDKPTSISTGIFGNAIDTKDGIKVYSRIAGESKDIFNPFRKPTTKELNHLQNMVNDIYDDFTQVISKERKIETQEIIEIGGLVYTSSKAKKLYLIDGVINLNDLINKIVNENNFSDYKIVKKHNQKNSLLKEILIGNLYKSEINLYFECLTLRSSITSLLSYQSAGC